MPDESERARSVPEVDGTVRRPEPEPAPGIATRAVRDRLAGALGSMRGATTVGEIRAAWAAADRVAALVLAPEMLAELKAARAGLEDSLRARMRWLTAAAVEGRVVEHGAEWQLLATLEPEGLGRSARVLWRESGRIWPGSAAVEGGPKPAAPFARADLVRCLSGGAGSRELVEGRVVAVRDDRVTVRVRDAQGLRFPSLPWALCEPLQVDAVRAAELARCAQQQRARGLAMAWATVALDGPGPALDDAARAALRRALGDG